MSAGLIPALIPLVLVTPFFVVIRVPMYRPVVAGLLLSGEMRSLDKDRDEDRQRGLDAGADFYLTKGDFQNENFRQAVVDLIGAAG